jgi:hypothetical protein
MDQVHVRFNQKKKKVHVRFSRKIEGVDRVV